MECRPDEDTGSPAPVGTWSLLLVIAAVVSCASKSSGVHGPGVVMEEPGVAPEEAGGGKEPATAVAPDAIFTGAHEKSASDGGWTCTVDRVSGDSPVSEFRWLPSGGLVFRSAAGWMLYEGGEAETLEGEGLDEALASSLRPWQQKKYKWKVSFSLEMVEGNVKCDDVSEKLVARLDVCLRKSEERCHVRTFLPDGELPFPWDESMAPAGMEALDILAFPTKTKLLLGRGRVVFLFTFDPMPDPLHEVEAKAPTVEDPCEDSSPVPMLDTFTSVEVLDDLVMYPLHLTATPYTIDGISYLYASEEGVWIGRFDGGAPPDLIVPLNVGVAMMAWSPLGGRIAILDEEGTLLVARVKAPGLTEVTFEESEIR